VFTFIPRSTDTLLLDVCRPSLMNVSLALPGPFLVLPSGPHLHGKYVINDRANEAKRPSVSGLGGDANDGPMVVEFDLAGPVQLNWPGSLYLTGGSLGFTYQASVYLRPAAFQETWHVLIATIASDTYSVPAFHSRISAYETLSFTTAAGATGELNHISIPCSVDEVLVFPDATRKTIVTEWYG
jgi:hypothetical protein